MLKNRNIPFWNLPFWRMLIFTVTYLNCFFMSNMSTALLFPTGDFDCVVLVSLGFSFLVVIDIGSLAGFTCFSSVDLSCIFCSILTLSSRILFLCCCCVLQVHYGTVSNSFHLI